MSHPNPSHNEESQYPSDNYAPVSKKYKDNALNKAKGGLVGKLKRTIKDKGLKRDHYADFKKQHKIT